MQRYVADSNTNLEARAWMISRRVWKKCSYAGNWNSFLLENSNTVNI